MLQDRDTLIKQGELLCIRLITGDEIIGEVSNLTSKTVSINKAYTLVQGPQGIGLGPASILGDPEKDIIYERSAIVAIITPKSQVVDAYKAQSSGLELPKQGIVVPGSAK